MRGGTGLHVSPPAILAPHTGPRRDIGATASAGKLRRYSRALAVLSVVLITVSAALHNRPWFSGYGLVPVLYGILYFTDLPLVRKEIRGWVLAFASLHLALGVAMILPLLRELWWVVPSDGTIYAIFGTAAAGFVIVSRVPVPDDDIIYQIREWRKHHRRKSPFR